MAGLVFSPLQPPLSSARSRPPPSLPFAGSSRVMQSSAAHSRAGLCCRQPSARPPSGSSQTRLDLFFVQGEKTCRSAKSVTFFRPAFCSGCLAAGAVLRNKLGNHRSQYMPLRVASLHRQVISSLCFQRRSSLRQQGAISSAHGFWTPYIACLRDGPTNP